MTTSKLSEFDMRETMTGYLYNIHDIFRKLPSGARRKPIFAVETDSMLFSSWEIQSHVLAFPPNSRQRINRQLKKITGKQPAWFHRDSTWENPIETNDILDAISPTAIIPSKTDNDNWIKTGIPETNIVVYRLILPRNFDHYRLRRIILSQALLHEMAHVLSYPSAYIADYQLMQGSKSFKGKELLINFAKMAEKHPPISHYASLYRDVNGKFKVDDPKKIWTPICEELAETIVAYLLGFSYCGDRERNIDPFADRPEIEEWIKMFLNLKEVK